MVSEIVHRPYSKEEVDRWKQSLTSAGSWEKNPWWQRINPLTPSGPTRFVPSEAGEKILNEFKNRYGKTIHVVPNKPGAIGNLFGGEEPAGYFSSGGTGFLSELTKKRGGLIGEVGSALGGGSNDPLKRTVHLEENPTAFTLAHELGHAFDPNLTSNWKDAIKQYKSAYEPKNWINPSTFLQRFIKPSQASFESEILAQKEAAKSFEKHGLKDEESQQDLGQYPYSYIQQGLGRVEEQLTQPNVPQDLMNTVMKDRFEATSQVGDRQPFKTKYDLGMTYPNTFFDYSDQNVMNQLGLALNTDYQRTKEYLKNKYKTYAKQELGDRTNLEIKNNF